MLTVEESNKLAIERSGGRFSTWTEYWDDYCNDASEELQRFNAERLSQGLPID